MKCPVTDFPIVVRSQISGLSEVFTTAPYGAQQIYTSIHNFPTQNENQLKFRKLSLITNSRQIRGIPYISTHQAVITLKCL